MAFVNRGALSSTVTVSVAPDLSGNFVCSGAADQIEINAAIVYVGALGGGEVKLLQETFTLAVEIFIDVDYILLRGCGHGTILLQTAADQAIHVTNDRTHITIQDLQIDGNGGVATQGIQLLGTAANHITWCRVEGCYIHNTDTAIGFTYVDYSDIVLNMIRYNLLNNGISLSNSDGCNILGNQVEDAVSANLIYINSCEETRIVDNRIRLSSSDGIILYACLRSVVVANHVEDADYGIVSAGWGTDHIIVGNYLYSNTQDGIYLDEASRCIVVGNHLNDNASDGITLEDSDHNLVDENFLYSNGAWGINIISGTGNQVKDNMYQGNVSGCLTDGGTNTVLATKSFQFTAGGDEATGIILANFLHGTAVAKGWEIDAATEFAIALGHLPLEVQQVIRIKIWAVGLAAPGAGNQMELEVVFNAGASDEAFNLAANSWTHANLLSNETAFAINDVISWTIDATVEAEVANLLGGDNFELKVIHEAAVPDDVETDAVFRIIEVEFV